MAGTGLTPRPGRMAQDWIEFDFTEFNSQFRRFMELSARSVEEEFRAKLKAIINTVVDITPPAHGKGTRGKARKMGQGKIVVDLVGGRHSLTRGKRRAGVFTVLSDSLVDAALSTGLYQSSDNVRLWTTKDGRVYGTQQHFFRPDAGIDEMRQHHKRYFKNGEMSAAGTYTRDIGRWKWIDQMVVRESTFNRYLRSVQRNVGFYAAGWRPSAESVGLTLPAYMKGHAALGSFSLVMDEKKLEAHFLNRVGFETIDRDVQRRIQWAISEEARKMERQIPHLLRKHEQLVN